MTQGQLRIDQASASKSKVHPVGLSGRSTAIKYQRHEKYRNNGGGQTSWRKTAWKGGIPKQGWTRSYGGSRP